MPLEPCQVFFMEPPALLLQFPCSKIPIVEGGEGIQSKQFQQQHPLLLLHNVNLLLESSLLVVEYEK